MSEIVISLHFCGIPSSIYVYCWWRTTFTDEPEKGFLLAVHNVFWTNSLITNSAGTLNHTLNNTNCVIQKGKTTINILQEPIWNKTYINRWFFTTDGYSILNIISKRLDFYSDVLTVCHEILGDIFTEWREASRSKKQEEAGIYHTPIPTILTLLAISHCAH